MFNCFIFYPALCLLKGLNSFRSECTFHIHYSKVQTLSEKGLRDLLPNPSCDSDVTTIGFKSVYFPSGCGTRHQEKFFLNQGTKGH